VLSFFFIESIWFIGGVTSAIFTRCGTRWFSPHLSP